MDNYIGKQFEQYKIEALIGSGSNGNVFRATDTNLTRPVVLKLLKPSLTKHPARTAANLKSRSVCLSAQPSSYRPFLQLWAAKGASLFNYGSRARG